ncbi:hypothetical protein DHEL01_v203822 [Diaporthe helianthi]|uniref:Uncharacterized protein n=1 Tax=Diaporthe helianthi TaxID=158607 RepID=A0A2P5I5J9_DIAHE|nr:hypothetical protein DHEL01_v203822 [Diaporthe helianthi]
MSNAPKAPQKGRFQSPVLPPESWTIPVNQKKRRRHEWALEHTASCRAIAWGSAARWHLYGTRPCSDREILRQSTWAANWQADTAACLASPGTGWPSPGYNCRFKTCQPCVVLSDRTLTVPTLASLPLDSPPREVSSMESDQSQQALAALVSAPVPDSQGAGRKLMSKCRASLGAHLRGRELFLCTVVHDFVARLSMPSGGARDTN